MILAHLHRRRLRRRVLVPSLLTMAILPFICTLFTGNPRKSPEARNQEPCPDE